MSLPGTFVFLFLFLRQCSALEVARLEHHVPKQDVSEQQTVSWFSGALWGQGQQKSDVLDRRNRIADLNERLQDAGAMSTPALRSQKPDHTAIQSETSKPPIRASAPVMVAPSKVGDGDYVVVPTDITTVGSMPQALVKLAKAGSGSRRSVQEAAAMLSAMLRNVTEGIDIERSRCTKYKEVAEEQLCNSEKTNTQDQDRLFRDESIIESNRGAQDELKANVERLTADLNDHEEKCRSEDQALRDRSTSLETDMAMAEHTSALSPCSGTTALLQCRPRGSSKPFFTFRHHGLKTVMTQLSSSSARQAMQHALSRLSGEGSASSASTNGAVEAPEQEEDEESDVALLQKKSKHRRLRLHHHKHGAAFLQSRKRAGHRARRGSGRGECTVAKVVNCQAAQEAMILMLADVQDKQHDLQMRVLEKQAECSAVKEDYTSQISLLAGRDQKLQQSLASTIYEKNQLQEEMRLKQAELLQVRADVEKTHGQCEDNMKSYEDQMCNLKQMRAGLSEIESGAPLEVQDCQVSPWIPEACSAQCDGGGQRLTRRVIAPAGPLGMECPPLEMRQACNESPCPVDCQVSAWSEWSSCSGLCGGGSRSRTRVVNVHAQYGGQPCPEENNEMEQCNTESCDADCKLGDWSSFGSCSRACGGGFQRRNKKVLNDAKGNGYCPSSEDRWQYLQCNKHACPAVPGQALQCNSKIDLVIVLDGSNGIGQPGFEQLKAFANALITNLQLGVDKAQVAVVTMSGPTTWNAYKSCESEAEGLLANCGVHLSIPFSSDPATTSAAVSALAFPGNAAYASGALSLANSALIGGRQDAQGTVLVVSHGQPLSKSRTADQAEKLRAKSRLMWLLVGDGVTVTEAAEWASRPARDNVLRAKDATELAAVPKVSEVVSAVCPVLG